MARSLPASPNLDHLRREAKGLLRDARAGQVDALALLRTIPRYAHADAVSISGGVSLNETQHALAVDYGFPGWKDLKRHVASLAPSLGVPRPVLKVSSYEQAVDHYVGWLGFRLDWEWREGPGAPTIAALSRDGFEFMINEHPDTIGPAEIHVNVKNFEALVAEWNRRRPGSVQARVAPPYEFPDLPIPDPFGNVLVFAGQDVAAQAKRRERVIPKMRAYVQGELDAGRPCPTPEQVREAVGPPLGVAIEVLNEFPEYEAAYRARSAGVDPAG